MKSVQKLTRRKFIAKSAQATAGTIVAAKILPQMAQAASKPPEFHSTWDQSLDRVWVGPDCWANPMQDWRVADGRVECVNAALDRQVHVLTRQVGPQRGNISMSVRVGRVGGKKLNEGKGSFGVRLGILGTLKDYPEMHDYRNNLWPAPGSGFHIGLTSEGGMFTGNLASTMNKNVRVDLNRDAVDLRVEVVPKDDDYEITLTVFDTATQKQLGQSTVNKIPSHQIIGNIALINNFGTPVRGGAKNKGKAKGGPNFGNGQFWFSDWKISGTKLTGSNSQTYGPILFCHYTLSGGVMKMTAQMPPLGDKDDQTVRLQFKKDKVWKTVAEAAIHPRARTATFRVENWDAEKEVEYRLAYVLRRKVGSSEDYWTGTIRPDPVDKDVLTVGDVSCNIHTIFPNVEFVENMRKLDPDLIAFVGDQFYENCGGYGVQRAPLEPAILDYLRKWYFHGWTWREMTKDRPCLSLPDDHDVYQGNLWGEGGDGRKTTQEAGGYDQPAEWVNVVHRTQASHHPDPYDPTPCKRGTMNYYGAMTYGGVSFAIIADRQYKSGPEGKVPPTGDRGDHVVNPNFDPKTADLPGLQLLGEKQMQFLREWVTDWKGAEMKTVVSQTIFTAMATTHGGNQEVLFADYDANGWPQTPRDEALKIIRKGFAFHIAGDQHLPAVVHYGIDDHKDAGVAFAGPAVNVGYPRWWEPKKTGRNRKSHNEQRLGDFMDHFGNPLTVLAFKNGPYEPPKPIMEQVVAKTSGLGLVSFDKKNRKITIDCWPYDADPTKRGNQFPGWPVVIDATDNYGRKPAAHLPALEIKGIKQPVIEVIDEQSKELVYALRVKGGKWQPHVFAEGKYTVKVSEPETGKNKTLSGLVARSGNKEKLKVSV